LGQTALSSDFPVTTMAEIKAKPGDTSADFFFKKLLGKRRVVCPKCKKKKKKDPIARVG